jgi:hypothetical protein
MTTTAVTTTAAETRTAPGWRTAVLAGSAAAVATTAIAAAAFGAGVPLTVEGEQIPLLGFAQMTLLGAAIGFAFARALARWASSPRRTFTVVTVTLTALSLVPDLTVAATPASKAVLIATHLAAAAIVIPAFARRLAPRAH